MLFNNQKTRRTRRSVSRRSNVVARLQSESLETRLLLHGGGGGGEQCITAPDFMDGLLSHQIAGLSSSLHDVDGSGGPIDETDATIAIEVLLGTHFGDLNFDNLVNRKDLAPFAANWQTVGSWVTGDFTGDGITSSDDLTKLAMNWGQQGLGPQLTGIISGPASSTFGRGSVGVNVANTTVSDLCQKTNHVLRVQIEAQNEQGNSIAADGLFENLRIRNLSSGATFTATKDGPDDGKHMFTITAGPGSANFVVELDATSNGNHGDRLRVVIDNGESTSTGNWHSYEASQVTVAQKTTGTSDTVVENGSVLLFAYEVMPNHVDDARHIGAKFEVLTGNGNDFTLELFVDSTGDGNVDLSLENGLSVGPSNIYTFNNLDNGGFDSDSEQVTRYEVHGTASSSFAGSEFSIGFATGEANYLEFEEVLTGASLNGISTDGVCASSCQIVTTTADSIDLELLEHGSVFFNLDSTPVPPYYLLLDAESERIFPIEVRADHEEGDISFLGVEFVGPGAGSVERVLWYRDNEPTPFGIATKSSCDTTPFDACLSLPNQDWIVPKNGTANVVAVLDMYDDSVGQSGLDVALQIPGDAINGDWPILASGNTSSNPYANGAAAKDIGVFVGTDVSATANQTITGVTHTTSAALATNYYDASLDGDGAILFTGELVVMSIGVDTALHGNGSGGLNNWTLDLAPMDLNIVNVEVNSSNIYLVNQADPFTQHFPTSVTNTNGDPISGLTEESLDLVFGNMGASPINSEASPGSTIFFDLIVEVNNNNTSLGQQATLQASLDLDDIGPQLTWSDDVTTFVGPRYYNQTIVSGPTYIA